VQTSKIFEHKVANGCHKVTKRGMKEKSTRKRVAESGGPFATRALMQMESLALFSQYSVHVRKKKSFSALKELDTLSNLFVEPEQALSDNLERQTAGECDGGRARSLVRNSNVSPWKCPTQFQAR
jgi:hypothetical protein